MYLKNIIKEELNKLNELLDDSELDEYQLEIKSLSINDIIFDCLDSYCYIKLKQPYLNKLLSSLTKKESFIREYPVINFNELNRINITNIPNYFRNIGFGKKIYKAAAKKFGFIGSNQMDRSKDAKRVWNSLKKEYISSNDNEYYYIYFYDRNEPEFLIHKDKLIESLNEIFKILDKKYNLNLDKYETNIPEDILNKNSIYNINGNI